MDSATIIVIIVASVIALFVLWLILFYGKKPKKKKEEKPQKTVEPAIKPSAKKEEPKKEEEPVKVTMPSENLKALRKQSQVKINKKALKTDSRNPSITKVFVNGKNVDENPEPAEPQEEDFSDEIPVPTPMPRQKEVGRFGAREPEFVDHTSRTEGMPNRSPTIGDRTNFGSHLNVSKDNNLSGVSGTGIAKAVEKSENMGKDIDQRTANLVESVRRNMLGEQAYYQDPLAFLQGGGESTPEGKSPKDKLKEIDAQTLVIADAIANPKHKKK